MKQSLKADLALLSVTVFWGAGFPITKFALETISPMYFIGIRFLIASLLLGIIFYKKMFQLKKDIIKSALILSSLLFLTYALQTVGIQFTTASKSGFYSGLAVLFVPIFLAFYSGTKLKGKTFLSIIMATAGLFLLSYSGDDFSFNFGDFLTVLNSVTFAWQLILTGTFVANHDATLLAIIELFFVSIFGFIGAFIFEPLPSSISMISFGSLLFAAVLCTAFAFWTQTVAQKYTTASHVAIIFVLEPLFGALTSWMLLGEVLGVKGFMGGALIVIAMLLAEP